MLLLLTVVVLSEVNCGGSRGNCEAHQAALKLSTTGIDTTIAGIDVILQLPAGVTYRDAAPSNVVAAANPLIAINPNVPGEVHIGVVTTTGFRTGDFFTVNCDIADGSMPNTADFLIRYFGASDLDGRTLDNLAPILSVEIH